MEYVNLGRTGLRVSRICLGMMSFGNAARAASGCSTRTAAEPIVRRAVEGGITFFDTADVYNGGRARSSPGGSWRAPRPREEYVARDQGVRPDDARARTAAACRASTSSSAIDASLRRLGMDYVDLYQIHRWDTGRRSRRRWRRCTTSSRAGKARYIGASSMYAWQFAKAQRVAERTAGRDSSRCRTTTT